MATPSPELMRELLLASSRTFALGIERLREPLRQQVRLAYLLLRISDYLEDSPTLDPERKAALLGLWDGVLAGDREVGELMSEIRPEEELEALPDAQVAAHAPEVVAELTRLDPAARAIVLGHVRDSTRGMARWALRGDDFSDESDLDDYMHEVAGRVGYLLSDLFAIRDRRIADRSAELRSLGRSFGLGLQTVNVIRGLHHDRDRGWLYVPRTFMMRPDGRAIEESELFAPGATELRRNVLRRLAVKARAHLDDAMRYTLAIPRRHLDIRVFCALPLLYAERTLAESEARGEDVFFEEVKITRRDVRSIGRAVVAGAWSNLALRTIRIRVRGGTARA